jgi:5-methylcytosine-specific restriction endonuclease McrA
MREKGFNHSEKTRNKMRLSAYKLKLKNAIVGEKNPNWRGGKINWKKFQYADKADWIKISKEYKTDHPFCERCGATGEQVHHRDFGTENHATANLQTLCRKCHRHIHLEIVKEGRQCIQKIIMKV